jgi:dipeptidase D
MNQEIESLEPLPLWTRFAALNAVPRGSKNEQRATEFMTEFGRSLGLETLVDQVGNVIVRKPATPGMEDRAGVVLQGHLDMVHQKNAATEFDFETQGIQMYRDGDWVKARGTTLGADNGIGVAAAMALLAADDIPHPRLEALFTVDEETGMTGAQGLAPGLLTGEILLNLDSEDDRELTIGCAGGVDVTVMGAYEEVEPAAGAPAFLLSVSGLTGGHSGMDIHRGRANSNKLLNRLLLGLQDRFGAQLGMIDAGGLRNAIPREARATFLLAQGDEARLQDWLGEQSRIIESEYAATDPGLTIAVEAWDWLKPVFEPRFQKRLLQSIAVCPNGIHRMSPEVPGLVQTSNNLARVRAADGRCELLCLTRGSVDTEKMDLASSIAGGFELIGADVVLGGAYPGWQPAPKAPIVQFMSRLYEELFGEQAQVLACHAGLECGILGTNYPDMQMISFGPNIRGAHSPDERVQVSSVRKFWDFLLQALGRIPAKAG